MGKWRKRSIRYTMPEVQGLWGRAKEGPQRQRYPGASWSFPGSSDRGALAGGLRCWGHCRRRLWRKGLRLASWTASGNGASECEGITPSEQGLFLLGKEPSWGWSSSLDLSSPPRCQGHCPASSLQSHRATGHQVSKTLRGRRSTKDPLPGVMRLPALMYQPQDVKWQVSRSPTSCPANEISLSKPASFLLLLGAWAATVKKFKINF